MNRDERRILMLHYAAGVLDPAQEQQVRAMLAAGDPEAQADLAEARAVLVALPAALPRVEPPTSAKAALHDRVVRSMTDRPGRAAAPPVRPTRRRSLGAWLAMAAALGGIISSAALFYVLNHQVSRRDQTIANLRTLVQQQQVDLTAMKTRLDSARQILEALHAPGIRAVAMAGTDPQPEARGWLTFDPSDQSTRFVTRDMAPAPAGQTYQLWLVTTDDRKVSVGTFDVGEDGDAILVAQVGDALDGVAVAAVTNEPTGGSPQPTGEFQLLGEFH